MTRGSIQVAYRDHDRTPLLYVIKEMAEQYEDLEVRIDQVFDGDAYQKGFLGGDLDLVCETFRAIFPARRDGHPVRCIAVTHNFIRDKMLARAGISQLSDLAGKTIAVRATPSSQLTSRHWVRHLGLADTAKLLIIDDEEVGRWGQWQRVISGEADAVICSPLYGQPALQAGLHDLNAPSLPQIGPLFFAGLGPFIAAHDDELRRFVRALYRALYVFHNDPETMLRIMGGEPARLMGIKNESSERLGTKDQDRLRVQYEQLRDAMDTKAIPRLDALNFSFGMLKEEMGGLDDFNPLTAFDLRYVLELEEAGFEEQVAREHSQPPTEEREFTSRVRRPNA